METVNCGSPLVGSSSIRAIVIVANSLPLPSAFSLYKSFPAESLVIVIEPPLLNAFNTIAVILFPLSSVYLAATSPLNKGVPVVTEPLEAGAISESSL